MFGNASSRRFASVIALLFEGINKPTNVIPFLISSKSQRARLITKLSIICYSWTKKCLTLCTVSCSKVWSWVKVVPLKKLTEMYTTLRLPQPVIYLDHEMFLYRWAHYVELAQPVTCNGTTEENWQHWLKSEHLRPAMITFQNKTLTLVSVLCIFAVRPLIFTECAVSFANTF